MGKLLSHCWISDCMVVSLRQKVAQLQIYHGDRLPTQWLVDADDLLLSCFSNLDGSLEGCTVLHLLCKQWWQLHWRWCCHSDSTGQADLSSGPHACKNQDNVFWTLEAASMAQSFWSTTRPKSAGRQQPGHWWHQPGHSVACCFCPACSPAERWWCRLGGRWVLLPLQTGYWTRLLWSFRWQMAFHLKHRKQSRHLGIPTFHLHEVPALHRPCECSELLLPQEWKSAESGVEDLCQFWTRVEDLCQFWTRVEDLCQFWTRVEDLCQFWTRVEDLCQFWTRVEDLCQFWTRVEDLCQFWTRVEDLCQCWTRPALSGWLWGQCCSLNFSPRENGHCNPEIQLTLESQV